MCIGYNIGQNRLGTNKGYFIMIRRSIHLKDIKILKKVKDIKIISIYAHKNKVLKYVKQKK